MIVAGHSHDSSKKNVPLRHNAWQLWGYKYLYSPL